MRKIICSVLAFVIVCFSIFDIVQAEEINSDIKRQQEELKNQIDEKSGQLENVKEEISTNLEQVQKLDEKINNSQKDLDYLNEKVEKLQTSIQEVENNLKVINEKYNKQKKLLDNRLIAIYESSETQYLDVILNSKSISEFLSNYFLITELASHDIELLEDIEEKKDNIDKTRKKLEKDKEELGIIKANKTKTSRILENTKTIRENYINKLSNTEKKLQMQIDEYNAKYNEINNEILRITLEGIDSEYIGGELAWPVPGYTRINSEYGMRFHPILHVNKLHTGVDIGAPMGANFVASNDGVVTKASYNGAYGNMVMIDHGGGISTLYAHGSEILVEVGHIVKRGDPVLKVGSTGYSTGPHAHFEVRINGVYTDPLPYITNGLVPKAQEKVENVEKVEQ